MSLAYRVELCTEFVQIGEPEAFTFDGFVGNLAAGEWTLSAPSQAIGDTDPAAVDSILVREVSTGLIVYAGVLRKGRSDSRFTSTVQDDGFLYTWQGTDVYGLLGSRLAFPTPATVEPWADGYDSNTGTASAVAAAYINDNLAAAPVAGRTIPNVTVTDPGIGSTLSWDARLQPIDLLVTAICEAGGITVDATFDDATQDIVYEFRTGVDLSGSIILSDVGDLETASTTRDAPNATWVLGAAQGELEARTFRSDNSGATGFDRVEYLYDNTNIVDGTTLQTATTAQLNELNNQLRVDALAAPDGPNVPEWRTDYLLGDILGIEIDGVRFNATVSKVRFQIGADRSIVYPIFGTGTNNDLTALVRKVDRVAARQDGSQLERPVPTGSATITTVTPATNFDATLVMTRYGPWATMLITMERTGVNIGATTAVVATVDAAGRGTYAAFGQALAIRTSAASALADSSIRYNASTGALTAQWHNAWNTGVIVSFSGVVFLGTFA